MTINEVNGYSVDPHIAEIYDRVENGTDDLNLIRKLLGPQNDLRILEPFCGTGRLLIPLASDGHTVCGMDQSPAMLDHARGRISKLPDLTSKRITLIQADVLSAVWPDDFDVVILGCNCFYELASPAEQRQCVQFGSRSLKPGGYIFIDSEHMEGDLADTWQIRKITRSPLSGICADGTRIESAMEPIRFDAPNRLVKFRRYIRITSPEGKITEKEYIQQKHPVSTDEVKQWMAETGFTIIRHMGDHAGSPYLPESRRSIFWARFSDSTG
jgi:SAM-dependent methyltransferase